ncbi:MAG: hypothetical protein R3256_09420, partial [Thalassovita sp.]|nr:hypothetical protein [Thalassovita sp.]
MRHSVPDRTLDSLSAADGTATGYTTAAALPTGSLDDLANYLTDGYWEDAGTNAHKFDTSSSTTISVNLDGLTADGRKVARWALDAWEMVAGLSFLETSDSAKITFDDDADGATTDVIFYTDGFIDSATINIS